MIAYAFVIFREQIFTHSVLALRQIGCLPDILEFGKLLCLQKSYLYEHSSRLTIYVFRLNASYVSIYAEEIACYVASH